MKYKAVLGVLLGVLASNYAYGSSPVLRFNLIENKAIKTTCVENGVQERSRIKLVEVDKWSGTTYRNVKFKAWLCTKKYGFREVKLWVNIPEILFNPAELQRMRAGQTINVSGIPSTNDNGRNLNLQVTRKTSSSVFANGFSVAVDPVQVSWPNRPEGNNEYQPLTVFVADDRDLESVDGFRSNFHQPWQKIIFQYTHSFAGTFVLEGVLESAAVER